MWDLLHLRTRLHDWFIQPRSTDVDGRRREFILNVLLAGLIVVGVVALLARIITFVDDENFSGTGSILVLVLFVVILLLCHRAVRAGYARLVSYVFLTALMLVASELMWSWSFVLPQALLAYIMAIVIAGILLGARAGLMFMAGSVALIGVYAFCFAHGYVRPDLAWRAEAPVPIDAIGYGLVFLVIGLVSWLSNREIDQSLYRARQSEAALQRERDSLENKVAERTRQLEQTQLLRVMELERFAAFGKITAGLVHDMSNPLMAATLNLQQVKAADNRQLTRVSKGLAQIERHLQAARRQLQGGGRLETFSVARELREAVDSTRLVARRYNVKVTIPRGVRITLYGDAVKFNQIVSNVLVNAIESYSAYSLTGKRVVTVSVRPLKQGINLTVRDKGSGILEDDLQHIFEPFYSKKPELDHHTGLGIGLGIVKQFVEQDFRGSVRVASTYGSGTKFSITLKSVENPHDHS